MKKFWKSVSRARWQEAKKVQIKWTRAFNMNNNGMTKVILEYSKNGRGRLRKD